MPPKTPRKPWAPGDPKEGFDPSALTLNEVNSLVEPDTKLDFAHILRGNEAFRGDDHLDQIPKSLMSRRGAESLSLDDPGLLALSSVAVAKKRKNALDYEAEDMLTAAHRNLFFGPGFANI